MTTAQHLSQLLAARDNCRTSGNAEWYQRHTDAINDLMAEAPSGAGFDNGTTIDLDASKPQRLVFDTAFHHMTDTGMYDGWTEHTIVVRPTFDGFAMTIGGRNRNDIKDLIGQTFDTWLSEPV